MIALDSPELLLERGERVFGGFGHMYTSAIIVGMIGPPQLLIPYIEKEVETFLGFPLRIPRFDFSPLSVC